MGPPTTRQDLLDRVFFSSMCWIGTLPRGPLDDGVVVQGWLRAIGGCFFLWSMNGNTIMRQRTGREQPFTHGGCVPSVNNDVALIDGGNAHWLRVTRRVGMVKEGVSSAKCGNALSYFVDT